VAHIQTTQATAKKWKALQALGCLGMLTGIGLIVLGVRMQREGDGRSSNALAAVAAVTLLTSLPAYAVGRIGAWWYHG
jgi:hypothetical protein